MHGGIYTLDRDNGVIAVSGCPKSIKQCLLRMHEGKRVRVDNLKRCQEAITELRREIRTSSKPSIIYIYIKHPLNSACMSSANFVWSISPKEASESSRPRSKKLPKLASS